MLPNNQFRKEGIRLHKSGIARPYLTITWKVYAVETTLCAMKRQQRHSLAPIGLGSLKAIMDDVAARRREGGVETLVARWGAVALSPSLRVFFFWLICRIEAIKGAAAPFSILAVSLCPTLQSDHRSGPALKHPGKLTLSIPQFFKTLLYSVCKKKGCPSHSSSAFPLK
jgi:hypothetical protein